MNKQIKGLIFLILTVVLFSTFEVTCKLVGERLHPLQVSLFRFFIGGVVLLPFAIYRIYKTKTVISWGFLGSMAILGIVNILISMGLIQFGLLTTPASTTAVIFSSNPLFVALFAALILKEGISTSKALGMVTGLVGVFILFMDKIELASILSSGPGLVLMAAITFALYTVLGKRLTLKNTDSLVMTSISFIIGSFILVPFMIVFNVPLLAWDVQVLPHIIYLGVFVSGLAYMLYFYGLANINTSAGALIYFIKPALAALFSVFLLEEKLTLNFHLGTVVILVGLTIVNYRKLRELRSLRFGSRIPRAQGNCDQITSD